MSRENDPDDDNDVALWRESVADVQPLHRDGSGRIEPGTGSAPGYLPPERPEPKPEPLAVAEPVRRPAAGHRGGGLNRRDRDRLRRGQFPIEDRVDLHGLRREQAESELARFLASSHAAGRRCVLVVTGKGSGGPDGGVLRSTVPSWLDGESDRGIVLEYCEARPQHGGGGALYVYLRKKR